MKCVRSAGECYPATVFLLSLLLNARCMQTGMEPADGQTPVLAYAGIIGHLGFPGALHCRGQQTPSTSGELAWEQDQAPEPR